MPSTKEIKKRIKSVNDTKKITNAMYLISSTKVRRAKKNLDNTRPYFDLLEKEISNIFSSGEIETLYANEANGKVGYLVISADKGLCGAYNLNVIKRTLSEIQTKESFNIYMVGEFGRNYLRSRNIELDSNFRYLAVEPTLRRTREMARKILYDFESHKIGSFKIIYTEYQNGLTEGKVKVQDVLPFKPNDYVSSDVKDYNYVPSKEKVLENIIPSFIMGYIYSALSLSYCEELSQRMNAMDNANRNAEELLEDLSIEFNHIRQGQITTEITEISAGAKAKRRKLEG